MGGAEERYVQGFGGANLQEGGHLEDPNANGRIILKLIDKKLDGGVDRVDVLRIKQAAGSCEHGNDSSGSIKCGEFFN
jgi:hypothetical protein